MNFLDILSEIQKKYPTLDLIENRGLRDLEYIIEREVDKVKKTKYESIAFGPDYWGIGGDLI